MLTPAQLDQLARSKGERFDRLFLQGMIRHHEGAVVMVETLLTGGEGGQESEVFQLASHIGTDQQVEIAAMKERLRQLTLRAAARVSRPRVPRGRPRPARSAPG